MTADLLAEAGPELADHLQAVLKKMTTENPGTGYHAFEIISRTLKTGSSRAANLYDSTLSEEEVAARGSFTDAVNAQVRDPADDDGNALGICALPDFNAENQIFKNAGVGFSDTEALAIMNSLRHFAAKNEDGLKKLRFWGKILGSNADYFVAEGQLEAGGEADENDKLFEPLGEGANTFAYWVCNDLANPQWTRLPEAKPAFVEAAARLKRVLTGDLAASVATYPHFEGTEADLLRSMIARITASTVLNVKGYLSRDEDGTVAETEEFQFPGIDALSKVGGWCHCTDYIMRWGRTSVMELDAEAEDEETQALYALQQEVIAEDPPQDLLRDADPNRWSARLHDRNTVAVRSADWPGAVCCYQDKVFANIYVGYGNPRALHPYYAGSDFYLAAPPEIQSDPVHVPEQAEPTPAGGPPAAEEEAAEEEAG